MISIYLVYLNLPGYLSCLPVILKDPSLRFEVVLPGVQCWTWIIKGLFFILSKCLEIYLQGLLITFKSAYHFLFFGCGQ